MQFGSSNKFTNVPSLAENGIITKKYLKDMETAVRQRTPVAGKGITLQVTDGGFSILTSGAGGAGGGKVYTLTVCSNGVPATIQVYGV